MAVNFREQLEAMGYSSNEIDNVEENMRRFEEHVRESLLAMIRAFESLKDSVKSLADFLNEYVERNPIPRTPYKPKTKLYIPDKRLKNHRCRNCC